MREPSQIKQMPNNFDYFFSAFALFPQNNSLKPGSMAVIRRDHSPCESQRRQLLSIPWPAEAFGSSRPMFPRPGWPTLLRLPDGQHRHRNRSSGWLRLCPLVQPKQGHNFCYCMPSYTCANGCWNMCCTYGIILVISDATRGHNSARSSSLVQLLSIGN